MADYMGVVMRRVILIGVLGFAGAYAFEQYTGKDPIQAFKSISFGNGGGAGGFAGGYGISIDAGTSIAPSMGSLGSGVSATFGSVGK